ncbi:unnamed protein product [Heterobilharzia americana]|nr:unnamed protein product [Heterobilharzia americana]
MATFDVSQDLFRKLVSMLTDWLKALDELTQEEEGVFKASQELHNLNADHKCTSSVDEIMYSVRSTYECNKSANQQLLLKPLEKICAVLPSINDIFIEREEILKEITQKSRKFGNQNPLNMERKFPRSLEK